MKKYFLVLVLLFVSSSAWCAEKDWTLLVFLNGHNNLDSFGQYNVDQMKSVDNKNVNIVVQWASLRHGKTRRVEVTKNNVKVLSEMAPVDMGDYHQLVDFVKWGVKNYPAKHYMIDVWNHGNGWKFRTDGKNISGDMQISNISYDDLTGHSIDTPQLGEAMKQSAAFIGHNVDIYGSDACLMQMIEIDYQLKGSVDYVVGSEETIPGEGWRYDALLAKWGNTPAEVAKAAVTTYFTSGYSDATMSAVDMSQIDGVVESLKTLKGQLETAKGVKAAIRASLNYTISEYVDIGDFLNHMKTADPTVNSADVKAAMDKFIIANQANGSKAASSGLSIWLPTSDTGDMSRYHGLDFDKSTAWGEMLQKVWK